MSRPPIIALIQNYTISHCYFIYVSVSNVSDNGGYSIVFLDFQGFMLGEHLSRSRLWPSVDIYSKSLIGLIYSDYIPTKRQFQNMPLPHIPSCHNFISSKLIIFTTKHVYFFPAYDINALNMTSTFLLHYLF